MHSLFANTIVLLRNNPFFLSSSYEQKSGCYIKKEKNPNLPNSIGTKTPITCVGTTGTSTS